MIEVKFEKTRAAAFDGGTLVGECDFCVAGSVWTIVHTGVDKAYGGQGIARRLVKCVAEHASRAGAKISPACSFAAREFESHPEEYKDVRI